MDKNAQPDSGDACYLCIPVGEANIELDDQGLSLLGTIPVPALDLSPYIRAVGDAHAYYTDPRNQIGTLNERLRLRNGSVRNIFVRLLGERKPLYEQHRVYQKIEARCKNPRSGGHKSCPGSYNFGSAYEIVRESFGYDGSGIKSSDVKGSVFSWWQQREGEGTNVANLWATAQLTALGLAAAIEGELQQLRDQLILRDLPTDKAIDPIDP